ncbi:MAG: protein translocase subunit SecD [Phycisphaerales bacterium]|nr:protein translocase subunit SecD [Phycisphaerales bacterium]
MKITFFKAAIVLVVLLLCLYAIFPPQERLRLGKDLAGGTSLVYVVNIDPKDDPREVMPQIIDVLQQRINPTGTLDITMTPMGGGRLEITMPLPSADVLALRDGYRQELEALITSAVTDFELEQVLAASEQRRADLISEFSEGSPEIEGLFNEVVGAQQDTAEVIAVAEAVELGDPQYDALEEAAAWKMIEEEQAREKAVSTHIDRLQVEQVLEASTEAQQIKDDQSRWIPLPSRREQGIIQLKASHASQAEAIDRVAAAHETYKADRKTLDDPADLMRLLRGAGVLTLHIAVATDERTDIAQLREELRERGPTNISSPDVAWFKINKIENWYERQAEKRMIDADAASYFAERYGTQAGGLVAEAFGGDVYLLMWMTTDMSMTSASGDWRVTGAGVTSDDLGRPAVRFNLDIVGERLLRQMSKHNIRRAMAVALDKEVYTAPTIQSVLGSGTRITGKFSDQEIRYLTRVLGSGSLQARLGTEPISINTLGPALGKDNLRRGLEAGMIAIIAVCIFMALYYFLAGFVADFALLCNAIIILGVMAMNESSFTLPGIAGIVLTFGMAVDANVLIYERIREELADGADLRAAVRLGFEKATSTIIDANITNLIICFVLGYTATTEVKGFAVTLGIGIIATLFSCLFVTRVIFSFYTDIFKVRSLSMLAMVLPVIQRVLTPNINWLKLRPIFILISAGFLALGFGMIFHQGEEMLDTEFRGGTAVTLRLKSNRVEQPDGSFALVPVTMTRQDVQDRILQIADEAMADDDPDNEELDKLRGSLDVLTVGDTDATGVIANTFQIKTTVENFNLLSDALILKFKDELDEKTPLRFAGSDIATARDAPCFPIMKPRIGDNLTDTTSQHFGHDVTQFQGGVAILLEEISPAVNVDNLRERIERIRNQPDFASTRGRSYDVVGLDLAADGEGLYRSAAILVTDENLSIFTAEDEVWWAGLAESEWHLTVEAMTRTTTLAGVQSFDSAIARSFKARAIVSVALSFAGILIYIWLRFGSLRYSLAAIVALVHDVLAVIGLIAFAEIIFHSMPAVANALQIEPFKIDLGLVAALLTIIGYSLNDTIVILDRIRENRGKLAYASAAVINRSINQTISRTLITSGTTFVAVLTLYIIGGTGIRSFSYALLCGVVVGTYSSIAVAAPLVYSRKADRQEARRAGGALLEDDREAAFAPATD